MEKSMKSITDTIIDILSETHLFEMAFDRKIVINKLNSLQDVLSFHVLLVCQFPESRDVPHWKGEIKGQISIAMRAIRGLKTKKLDYDTIYNILVEGPIGEWTDYLLDVERMNEKGLVTKPDANVHTRAIRILEHVCMDLSKSEYRDSIDYYFDNNK